MESSVLGQQEDSSDSGGKLSPDFCSAHTYESSDTIAVEESFNKASDGEGCSSVSPLSQHKSGMEFHEDVSHSNYIPVCNEPSETCDDKFNSLAAQVTSNDICKTFLSALSPDNGKEMSSGDSTRVDSLRLHSADDIDIILNQSCKVLVEKLPLKCNSQDPHNSVSSSCEEITISKDREIPSRHSSSDSSNEYQDTYRGHRKLVYDETKVKSDDQFKCLICNRNLLSQSALRIHHMSHSNDVKFKCRYCFRSYYKKYFLVHVKHHLAEKRFTCSDCGLKFLFMSQVRAHQLATHLKGRYLDATDSYACDICGDVFQTGKGLKRHQRVKGHAPKMARQVDVDTTKQKTKISEKKQRNHRTKGQKKGSSKKPSKKKSGRKDTTESRQVDVDTTKQKMKISEQKQRNHRTKGQKKGSSKKPSKRKSGRKDTTESRQVDVDTTRQKMKISEQKQRNRRTKGQPSKRKSGRKDTTESGKGNDNDDTYNSRKSPNPLAMDNNEGLVSGEPGIDAPNTRLHDLNESPTAAKRLFKCGQCNKAFKLRHQLAIHMKYHVRKNIFDCWLCDQSFHTLPTLTDHFLQLHSINDQYNCQLCGRIFDQAATAVEHHREHVRRQQKRHGDPDERRLTRSCKAGIATEENGLKSVRRSGGGDKLKTLMEMEYDVGDIEMGQENDASTEHEKGRSFTEVERLYTSKNGVDDGGKDYEREETFNTNISYVDAVRSDEGSAYNSIVDLPCTNDTVLDEAEQLNHQPERLPAPMRCRKKKAIKNLWAREAYSSKDSCSHSETKLHLSRESITTRGYKCKKCCEAFQSQISLIKHLRIHLIEKRHRRGAHERRQDQRETQAHDMHSHVTRFLEHPRCEESFRESMLVVQHKVVHSKEVCQKPMARSTMSTKKHVLCDKCGETFSELQDLEDHFSQSHCGVCKDEETNKDALTSFPCCVCRASFVKLQSLIVHMTTHLVQSSLE